MRQRTLRALGAAAIAAVGAVLGEKEHAVAMETRPHPEGAQAHLARWRALTHAGWRVHDAFGSRFGHDPARAAVELAHELALGR